MEGFDAETIRALNCLQLFAIENSDFRPLKIVNNKNPSLKIDDIWQYGNVMLYDNAINSQITRADIESDYYQIKVRNFDTPINRYHKHIPSTSGYIIERPDIFGMYTDTPSSPNRERVWHPYVCRVCVYPNFETPDELRRHEASHIRSKMIHCGKCRIKFDNMDDLRNHDPYCERRYGVTQEAIPLEMFARPMSRQEERQMRDDDRKYLRAKRNKKKCFFCCKKFRLAEYYNHSVTCSKRRGRSDTWDQKEEQLSQTHQVIKNRKRKYNEICR